MAEELKVAAVVEDQKAPLAGIFAVDGIHAGKGRAEPGAPANHLPEFRFAAHLFEKDKVDALRHIDAGVHHVYRNGNERRLVRLFEIVNDGLRIGIVTDDPLDEAGILLFQLRIQLAKPLPDELRMALVLGKDDGLADAVAARRLDAPFHQVLQNGVHGVGVEDELVQFFGRDKAGQGVVLGKIVLVAGFVLRRKLVVVDALFQKLGLDLIVVIGHQNMVCINGSVIIVGVGRDAVLHLEKVVGVAVYIGFRGGGQTHQNRIEIIKNGAVFLENAAVALVHDDKVKVGRGKQRHAVLGLGVVDGVEHGGIGGKHDARGLIVLGGAQVAQRLVRQILFEVVLCLLDQRGAVGQKEHVGHMTAPAQHSGQAGCGAGLACASSHDQQIAPEALRNMGADSPDGVFLIVTVGDLIVNFDGVQRLFLGAAVHQLLQIVLAEHAAHRPLRAACFVPEIGGVAVGGE